MESARTASPDPTSVQDRAPIGAYDDDDQQFFPVSRLRREYIDYLAAKILEIEEQKIARHYYHGAQWTADEIRILRKRHQPILTFNLIEPKINGIVGLIERLRQDPKAFPRQPRHDNGAEVATATVRYVLDANDWKTKSQEVAKQCAIEGIGGIELKLVQGDHGDPTIGLAEVAGDDFFYDPRSFRYDFSDARYMGLAKWLDVEAAVELFPDKEDEIRSLLESGYDLTTHADREYKWILVNEKRVRLVEHWYLRRGQWCWAFYVSNTLLDQGVSPFMDENNKTIPRFIMFSAAVDHDGDRYGFVRNFKSPQDEYNQRRSKALHISNTRRLILEKGAVDSVESVRREWARPDGVVEINPGYGDKIKADDATAKMDLESQMGLMTQAEQHLRQYANVQPATAGEMPKNVSGRAINLLQQGGIAELGPYVLAYRGWKIRLYRAIWNAAQRFWTGERWIRVTDDQDLAQFIQLNGLGTDDYGQPTLVNAVGSLDVDIQLDEGPDVVNMMADTFDTLSALAQNGANVPPQVLIELSPIQGSVKQRILQMMQPSVDPAQNIIKRMQIEDLAAGVEVKRALSEEKRARAVTDAARASHLASEAGLNSLQAMQMGMQNAVAQPPVIPPAPSPYNPGMPGPQPPQGVPGPGSINGLPGPIAGPFGGSPGGSMPQSGPFGEPLHPAHALVMRHAQRGHDGHHYIRDPRRAGSYLRVVPRQPSGPNRPPMPGMPAIPPPTQPVPDFGPPQPPQPQGPPQPQQQPQRPMPQQGPPSARPF